MSSVKPLPTNTQALLSELFSPIKKDLVQAEARLRRELRHPEPFIDELAQ